MSGSTLEKLLQTFSQEFDSDSLTSEEEDPVDYQPNSIANDHDLEITGEPPVISNCTCTMAAQYVSNVTCMAQLTRHGSHNHRYYHAIL